MSEIHDLAVAMSCANKVETRTPKETSGVQLQIASGKEICEQCQRIIEFGRDMYQMRDGPNTYYFHTSFSPPDCRPFR